MKRTMMRVLTAAVLAGGLLAPAWAAQMINGAGATFPYPIYSKWFSVYHEKNGVRINYQSIGSGGGIRQISKKTVDFGATDGPMSSKQLYQAAGDIVHIPTVVGAVVAAYNLKSGKGEAITDLKLTGPVLADIYLGKIRTWDDAAIKALNPDIDLPGAPITVLRRADGSGTTYCFVDYLSAVSPEWKKRVGVNTSVQWPVGLGGKGNEGVAGLLVQTPNSIGYVEAIYAKQNDLPTAAMRNKAGKFVTASVASIAAAAKGTPMPKDFRVSIVDAAGPEAYPISTYTWLLVYKKNAAGKAEALKTFVAWMLADGQPIAAEMGYAPLPEDVRGMVSAAMKSIK